MAKLAKKITIDRRNKTVLIDGIEFEYHLHEDGPNASDPLNDLEIPIVYLPVLANDLEIIPEG